MSVVFEPAALGIRPMARPDIPAVLVNEESAYTHPWTEGILRDCLRVGYYCAVGELVDRVVAHAVMSLAVGEAHILNLCVHPNWQGQGYGTRLLEHLVSAARRAKALNMFLEVRESNRIAQRLYQSYGFNEIGQRPNYYPAVGGREAALVFALTLGDTAALEE